MTDSRATELIKQGDHLFGKRSTWISLCQEIANNFYIERADFTVTRTIGTTFAENLMTSYPLLARRDLGNSFSSMLRPTAKEWFKTTISREERLDDEGRRWLAMATGVQRRAMYDRVTQFHRATKEGDHDFAAFGCCVISAEMNHEDQALLYRTWHIRDVAWCENRAGKIDTIHRKWKPYARDVVAMWPKTCSQKVRDLAEKSPFEEVEIRHVVVPAKDWERLATGKKIRQKFVSIFVEGLGETILEEVGSKNSLYIIPRWQTVSGSQYPYSPATITALPDARLIQAMTLTLLEAGERNANPPWLATHEAIRGDVNAYPGGLTWAERDYDERLGDVLRPLTTDKAGMPFGHELREKVEATIKEAFFLNTISPQIGNENPEMTAFQVGQIVQDYIRKALPLFEPMEVEYNGNMCDNTFDLLLDNGAFGPHASIPQSLRGAEIQFRFESPLSEAIDAQKGQKLAGAKQLLALVADIDPTSAQMLDAKVALREALLGQGTPPTWIRTAHDMQEIEKKVAEQQQQQDILQKLQGSADVAQTLGQANAAFSGPGQRNMGPLAKPPQGMAA